MKVLILQRKRLTALMLLAIGISLVVGLLASGCQKGQGPVDLSLSVNPSKLTFRIQVPQTIPSSQTVNISKSGSGIVSWEVVCDANWLEVTPKSGTDSGTIKVSILSTKISAGDHSALISISSNADNATVTVPVSLVAIPSSDPLHLEVNPQSLNFEATRAQNIPSAKSLTFESSGTGILSWKIDDDAEWLDVSPSSGTGTGNVEISINSTCLSAGNHSATVSISSNADNSLVSLPISYSVWPAAINAIMERWPLESDRDPASRRSPITAISHQKNDERNGWQWTQVETTGRYHWQHDVKIEDDDISRRIHGNSDNHRLQVGEPAVFETTAGCYRLEFYIKHDRAGDNPIIGFKVYLENGIVTKVEGFNVRGAGKLGDIYADLRGRGLHVGEDIINWITGGSIDWSGLIPAILPEDWLHQYKGWQLDAFYFATQIGDLYARTLPKC